MNHSALWILAMWERRCRLGLISGFQDDQPKRKRMVMMEQEMEDPGSSSQQTREELPDIRLPFFGSMLATATRLVNGYRALPA